MDLDLEKKQSKKSVDILSRYLADSYFLYFKTHGFHWNVTGPHFYSLHKLFEEQYTALFESVDEIAERIRSLGSVVQSSLAQLQTLSSIKESSIVASDDKTMISALVNDHEQIGNNLKKWIVELGEINDMASEDFLISRLAEHDKMAWMLRAHLT